MSRILRLAVFSGASVAMAASGCGGFVDEPTRTVGATEGGPGVPSSSGASGDFSTSEGSPGCASPVSSSPPPGCGTTDGSLLTNGSFECPTAPLGGFLTFANGQDVGGWTVVGVPGEVSPLSTTFESSGTLFDAYDGAQAIDLTGPSSNSATGVAETVTTIVGAAYRLSFWIGNVDDPGAGYGTTSTVDVVIDGKTVLAATNEGVAPGALCWKRFSFDFVAGTSSTTVALVNGDPPDDSSNILDDVTLTSMGADASSP